VHYSIMLAHMLAPVLPVSGMGQQSLGHYDRLLSISISDRPVIAEPEDRVHLQ